MLVFCFLNHAAARRHHGGVYVDELGEVVEVVVDEVVEDVVVDDVLGGVVDVVLGDVGELVLGAVVELALGGGVTLRSPARKFNPSSERNVSTLSLRSTTSPDVSTDTWANPVRVGAAKSVFAAGLNPTGRVRMTVPGAVVPGRMTPDRNTRMLASR